MSSHFRILSVIALTLFTGISTVIAADTFTVVIDAGHGGKDPGAINGKKQEKDINLNVALETGRLIRQNCKDVIVIYTRDTDDFVELAKRADIANKAKADFFISIHTNSAKNSSANGAETYLLGAEENRTSANLSVATQENSAILLEKDYQTNYAGYDPKSPESQIIFEFMQNEYQKESLNMASLVQKELTGTAKRNDRGVHQAGFLVLWKSAMPSILIELGYISNQSDREYMTSSKGVEELSKCIYQAFKAYLETTRSQKALIAQAQGGSNNTTTAGKGTSAKSSPSEKKKVQDDTPVFKIQFLTSDTKMSASNAKFKGLSGVESYKDGKLYKYTCEPTTNYDEARKNQAKVREKYKDAFIVAFKGGDRIDLQKAIQEAGKGR